MTVKKVAQSAMRQLTGMLTFGRPVPSATERAIERDTLRRRIRQGPLRFDDVKRLNAIDNLDEKWGCKPLRVLLYKLGSDDD